MEQQSKDPLHGKRLDAILEELVEYYGGFEDLGKQINIRCFTDNPSINSSLKSCAKPIGQGRKWKVFTSMFYGRKRKTDRINCQF